MGKTVTTRISEELARDIELFTEEEHTDRSTMVRKLLSKAVEERKLDRALGKYREGEITLGRAAEMADVPLRKMMALASERGIPLQYGVQDLEQDFEAARSD